ncbi:MAG: SH3 domain-containing protein, partial [Candidatus Binatia bacterium]
MTRARRSALLAILLGYGLASGEAAAAPARISGAPLVYVRSGPGPDHQPVRILSEGDTVEKLEDLGSWTRIETPKGEIGFVYSSFVVETGAEAPIVAGQEPTPVAVPVAPELLPEEPAAAEEEAIAAEVTELR